MADLLPTRPEAVNSIPTQYREKKSQREEETKYKVGGEQKVERNLMSDCLSIV